MFSYIPLIQKTEKFGEWVELDIDKVILFPYVIPADLVNDFCNLMYELKLVIDLNWTNWLEKGKILAEADFKNIDTITLFQLLTSIIRSDRFSEGVLVSAFENGTFLNILIGLKANFENKLIKL